MPALRADRAPRACDSCRKLKTRCYPSKDKRSCLRCDTHGSKCSLVLPRLVDQPYSPLGHGEDHTQQNPFRHDTLIEERLGKLERTLETFITRVDSRFDTLLDQIPHGDTSNQAESTENESTSSAQDEAPILLIRNAAADIGIGSPEQTANHQSVSDIISTGIVTIADVYDLLSLFQIHYGRWVAFDDSLSTEQLLPYIRRSPLLLCSICLVAVRQADHQLATSLAPALFEEAKKLLLTSLLDFPQKLEFFQATLLLSLWSTTIGQVPLSLDSWLLSGYALQHASANPVFMDFSPNNPHTLRGKDSLRAQYVRTHLCISHLQYCVGTRRTPVLTQAQVDQCAKVLDLEAVPQFETRMIAEVKLYWIIYTQCCAVKVNIHAIRASLSRWKQDWAILFEQPRSQFLQMSHHFAILLTHCRSLQSKTTPMRSSTLTEMTQLARNIINLAIDNTDERTSHLTDHIYHIITFSAITLSQLLRTYRGKLGGPSVETALNDLIFQLIDWLQSIGFPCHVSRVLGDVIAAYHGKRRQKINSRRTTRTEHDALNKSNDHGDSVSPSFPPYGLSVPTAPNTPMVASHGNVQDARATMSAFDQDFSWTACFDFDAGAMEWPQYEDSTDGGSGIFAIGT